MTDLLSDLVAFFEARNTGNATNDLLNRCKKEQSKQLLIHGVSKSFAVGVDVEITDCIKGHEFHIGEKVTIVENDDNMWICRNKKGIEWYINEDEANVC